MTDNKCLIANPTQGGDRNPNTACRRHATLLIVMLWRVFDTHGDEHSFPTLHTYGVQCGVNRIVCLWHTQAFANQCMTYNVDII